MATNYLSANQASGGDSSSSTTGFTALGSTPATLTYSTAQAHEGSGSILATCDGTVSQQGVKVVISGGTLTAGTYTFSLWFRVSTAVTYVAYVTSDWDGSLASNTAARTADTWINFTQNVTISTNAASNPIHFGVYTYSAVATSIYLDDMFVGTTDVTVTAVEAATSAGSTSPMMVWETVVASGGPAAVTASAAAPTVGGNTGAVVVGVGSTSAVAGVPAQPPLTSDVFDTATFGGGVAWLYGLQESQGSATAGDVSGVGGRPTLALTAATEVGGAEFGSAGVMPEGTALRFEPQVPDGETTPTGRTLTGPTVEAYLGGEFAVFCVFAWQGGSSMTLLDLGDGALTLTVAGSTVTATVTGPTTSTSVQASAATGDNRPHMAVISATQGSLWLTVDQQQVSASFLSTGIVGNVQGLVVGSTATTQPHQLAWVGYANAGMAPADALDLANLGSGGSEPSGDRVRRICRWLGVGADLVADDGLSDVAYQAAGGNQALDLIAEANRVEDGVFFAAGDGTLRQHARDRRYDAAVRLELDATQVGPDTAVQVDLARVVNDLTVSRPAGATYRVHDAASVAAYGQRSATETLYAATDDALRLAAEWRVLRYSQPAPRIPAISINLLPMTADEAAAVLGLEIGDRVRVTSMPASTPGDTTVDLVVEGVEEQVSATSWQVRLATSPFWDVQPDHFDTAEFDAAIFAY